MGNQATKRAAELERQDQSDERINKVRLRLTDAAADLRPLPSHADLLARVRDVARDLESIRQDLLLIVHVGELERGSFLSNLSK